MRETWSRQFWRGIFVVDLDSNLRLFSLSFVRTTLSIWYCFWWQRGCKLEWKLRIKIKLLQLIVLYLLMCDHHFQVFILICQREYLHVLDLPSLPGKGDCFKDKTSVAGHYHSLSEWWEILAASWSSFGRILDLSMLVMYNELRDNRFSKYSPAWTKEEH